MTKNEYLYNLLNKYTSWAKFDWCLISYDCLLDRVLFYDLEEHKKRSLNYVMKLIFENGMLNECFTEEELVTFIVNSPARFTKEIEYYL